MKLPIFDIDLCKQHMCLGQNARHLGCSRKLSGGVPLVVQQKQIQLGTMRLRVRSLVSISGLRIRHYHELWCRSQTQLRSGVAVAVMKASSYSSDWTPSLGTYPCDGYTKKINK